MTRRILLLTVAALLGALSLKAQWNVNPPDAVLPDWRASVPLVIHPDTSLTRLYERAWDIAAGRVRRGPEGMVASPYLDENCYDDQIWIWDACFMVMFSKYAPDIFPGKETLLNFYAPIHDGAPSPLRIHWRDNPPLFAWIERLNYTFTGDTAHVDGILRDKRYLQRHYDWFNNLVTGERNEAVSPNPIAIGVERDSSGDVIGFRWSPWASGMDNTTRGHLHGGWKNLLWVDAICQQALAAENIAALCAMRGMADEASKWRGEYDRLRDVINTRYWDECDGFYYDIDADSGEPCRVMTTASFWAMAAGVPDSIRAARMVSRLRQPEAFGGERPWNSLSRTDEGYDSVTGEYWRGGIWLPQVYMGTKALERYGYKELADSLARQIIGMQARVYDNYEPHTIWECYNPNADGPSTEYGQVCRQEFCGWSALGPISLMIENLLGFRNADALTRTLTWDLNPANGRHGIERLRFGDIVTSLLYDPATATVTVTSNAGYTLRLNGRDHAVTAGTATIPLRS